MSNVNEHGTCKINPPPVAMGEKTGPGLYKCLTYGIPPPPAKKMLDHQNAQLKGSLPPTKKPLIFGLFFDLSEPPPPQTKTQLKDSLSPPKTQTIVVWFVLD